MQELIAQSRSDIKVIYDPVGSHAATRLADTPQLKALVIEARI